MEQSSSVFIDSQPANPPDAVSVVAEEGRLIVSGQSRIESSRRWTCKGLPVAPWIARAVARVGTEIPRTGAGQPVAGRIDANQAAAP
jgi:hypothetical protein